MTGAHLLFAVLTSAYVLTAIRWEERDLVIVHGSKYQDYQQRVPKLIPSLAQYKQALYGPRFYQPGTGDRPVLA